MEADLSFTRAPGAVALLLITLAACQAPSAQPVQTAQVGSILSTQNSEQPNEIIRLEGLRFKGDGASLRRNSKAILDAAADILKSEPDKKVYIVLYFEPTGAGRENLRLEQRRAENVKAYLEARGIPSERMITRASGPQSLDANNITLVLDESTPTDSQGESHS